MRFAGRLWKRQKRPRNLSVNWYWRHWASSKPSSSLPNTKSNSNPSSPMQNKFFHWLKHDFSSKITIRRMKEGEIVFASETSSLTLDPQIFPNARDPIHQPVGICHPCHYKCQPMFNAVNGKKCSNSLKASMCSFYGCECRLHRLAGNRMNTCRKGTGCGWDGKDIFMDEMTIIFVGGLVSWLPDEINIKIQSRTFILHQ